MGHLRFIFSPVTLPTEISGKQSFVNVLFFAFTSHCLTGEKFGQLYTYPAKRWKMKQRTYQLKEAAQLARSKEAADNGDAGIDFMMSFSWCLSDEWIYAEWLMWKARVLCGTIFLHSALLHTQTTRRMCLCVFGAVSLKWLGERDPHVLALHLIYFFHYFTLPNLTSLRAEKPHLLSPHVRAWLSLWNALCYL